MPIIASLDLDLLYELAHRLEARRVSTRKLITLYNFEILTFNSIVQYTELDELNYSHSRRGVAGAQLHAPDIETNISLESTRSVPFVRGFGKS